MAPDKISRLTDPMIPLKLKTSKCYHFHYHNTNGGKTGSLFKHIQRDLWAEKKQIVEHLYM